ncbi:MAG: hypothetical protein V4620_04890 [Bacteroidota bacterium]
MTEENILLLLSAITFLFIALSAKFSKKFSFFNALGFILYSVYLYFGLYYKGGENQWAGFYFICIVTGLHLLLVICYLVYQIAIYLLRKPV